MEEKYKQPTRYFKSGLDNSSYASSKITAVFAKNKKKRLAHLCHVWPDVLIKKQLQPHLLGDETCRAAVK